MVFLINSFPSLKSLNSGMQSKIIHEGKLTEPFEITTGMRHGCLLSPLLFLLAVDWIMRRATSNRTNGIQWTLLDDLDFADEIALLSHNQQQMQGKLTQVEKRAAETGLIISTQKTKVIKFNTNNQDYFKRQLNNTRGNRQLYIPR